MEYREYLHQENYSKTTIVHYLKRITEFTGWLKKRRITASEIDYKTCMKYIKHLQQKKIKPQTINNHLVTIRNYFDYLIERAERSENPLEDVSVKGTVKKMLHNLLEPDELEDLYYSYQTEKFNRNANGFARYAAKRNKIIVGLIVYQGLNATHLKSLNLENVQLKKGKIYVPATRRSNAREIELKPWQIIDFIEYLDQIRPQIAKNNDLHNQELLIPQKCFNDLLRVGILKRLKKINHKVINVNQLRASVICNWLGQYNIRKVQYLAGHKHIGSTESYKQNNLESLHEAINQFHPIH
ncbi:tyrosine-type recombinase/integrase [Aquimarina macrocephali]|uniref:tyrosine-type recombinase/integrase n=1 Tax=Aquimarina macrocephali TaxID=666563 RepID=UPI00046470FB|nr:site-specific integrase [Aquimarina macrocephali]